MKMHNALLLMALLICTIFATGAYTANYTTADIDDIVADNLGAFGVETKNYMALLVLGFVALVIVGIVVKIKSA